MKKYSNSSILISKIRLILDWITSIELSSLGEPVPHSKHCCVGATHRYKTTPPTDGNAKHDSRKGRSTCNYLLTFLSYPMIDKRVVKSLARIDSRRSRRSRRLKTKKREWCTWFVSMLLRSSSWIHISWFQFFNEFEV